MPLTPTGYVVRTQEEIRAEIVAALPAGLDTSDESFLGKWITINAERFHELELGQHAIWAAQRIDSATGADLEQLSALTGTRRRVAGTASTVGLQVTLQPGASLASPAQIRDPANTTTVWQTETAVTNSGGTPLVVTVNATATETGPRAAAAGTITQWITGTTGTVTVTNPADALIGSDKETETDLRVRREEELRALGSANVDAIVSAVEAVPGVISAVGLENLTDAVVSGIDPHSFKIVVWDSAGGAVNNAVAQAIWNTRPAGNPSSGALTGTAISKSGVSHTEKFSRASQLSIYMVIVINVSSGWDPVTGPVALKQYLSDQANAAWKVGQVALRSPLYSYAFASQLGVANVSALHIGTAPAPSTDADVTPAADEIPRMDPSRISLTWT